MNQLDLSELDCAESILDAVESQASPSCHFQLGQHNLLSLNISANKGKLHAKMATQLLDQAIQAGNSTVGIAGTHSRATLASLCQLYTNNNNNNTPCVDALKTLARFTHTSSGVDLPISIHVTLAQQQEGPCACYVQRIDCSAMFKDGYVLPAGELTAQEPMLVLIRLIHCIQFTTPVGVCESSEVMLAMAAALLGVGNELEQFFISGAATQEDAVRNRNALVVLLFAGWLNHTLCSTPAATAAAQNDVVHVWTSPTCGTPEQFANDFLQNRALAMNRENLDGNALLQTYTTPLIGARHSRQVVLANLQILLASKNKPNKRIKAEYANVLLCGALQAELPPLQDMFQTQFWIRCAQMHLKNRTLLARELEQCGALAICRLYRTLPLCDYFIDDIAKLCGMVSGALNDSTESARLVLEAFQVTEYHISSTRVFFRNANGLASLVANASRGVVEFPIANKLCNEALERLRASCCYRPFLDSPPKRERLEMSAIDSARRKTRMSRKLDLVKQQQQQLQRRCKLVTLVRTIMLFQRLCRKDVLMRGQVRAVAGRNQVHCVLVANRSGELEFASYGTRADSLLQTTPLATWHGIVDYARLSDVSIELQFAKGDAIAVHFTSESCNQKWSFALEQSLQLPPKKKAAAPPAMLGQRRPSISRNLLGDVVNELVQTEKSYIADLSHFVEWFRDPIAAEMENFQIQPHEFDSIFINIVQIKVFHESLLQSATSPNGTVPMQACEQFARAFRERRIFFHKIYTVYTDRHSTALHTFNMCVKRSKRFAKFCQQTVNAHNQQDLQSFLIKPIQRMVKYPLFFKQLVDWVNREDTMAPESLRVAMEDTLQVSKQITQQVTVHDATRELRGVEVMLQCTFEDMPTGLQMCVPGRSFVDEFICRLVCTASLTGGKEEEVKTKKSSKQWHLFVLSDVVMFAKPGSDAKTFKYRGWFEFEDLRFSVPSTNNKLLEIVFTPPQEYNEESGYETTGDENRSVGSVSSFKSTSSTSSRFSSMKKRSVNVLRRLSSTSRRSSTTTVITQRFTLAFESEDKRNQAFAVLNRTYEALRALRRSQAGIAARGWRPDSTSFRA